MLTREKTLEKCALAVGTQASCLGDLTIQEKLQKAETKKEVLVQKKCGNRHPVASPPFCCRTAMPQVCMAATSRDDCTMNLGGQVMENKTCVAGHLPVADGQPGHYLVRGVPGDGHRSGEPGRPGRLC